MLRVASVPLEDHRHDEFCKDDTSPLVYDHGPGVIVQVVEVYYFWVNEICRNGQQLLEVGEKRRIVQC